MLITRTKSIHFSHSTCSRAREGHLDFYGLGISSVPSEAKPSNHSYLGEADLSTASALLREKGRWLQEQLLGLQSGPLALLIQATDRPSSATHLRLLTPSCRTGKGTEKCRKGAQHLHSSVFSPAIVKALVSSVIFKETSPLTGSHG